MDYHKIHNDIIFRAKMQQRKKLKRNHPGYVYYETHHILPRCVYPEYSNLKEFPWNKVLLTGREHYIIHQLLIFMYPQKRGLIWAAHKMTSKANTQQGRSKNKLYDWLKKLSAQEQSRRERGKKRSKESIEKRTETRRKNGWNRNPEETRKKQSLASKGKKKSKEHCRNLSASHKGIIYGPPSEEKRRKISEKNKGKHFERLGKTYKEIYGAERAAEIKEKNSNSHKGRYVTEDTRKKMSKAKKNKPWSIARRLAQIR